MSLANYLKKYGNKAVDLGKAGGMKLAEFSKDHPIGSTLAGVGLGQLGEDAYHYLNDEDDAGRKKNSIGSRVDDLLAKLGIG